MRTSIVLLMLCFVMCLGVKEVVRGCRVPKPSVTTSADSVKTAADLNHYRDRALNTYVHRITGPGDTYSGTVAFAALTAVVFAFGAFRLVTAHYCLITAESSPSTTKRSWSRPAKLRQWLRDLLKRLVNRTFTDPLTLDNALGLADGELARLDTILASLPLIGFLGTVWGIIATMDHLKPGAEQVESVKLGLAVALLTTLWGLLGRLALECGGAWLNLNARREFAASLADPATATAAKAAATAVDAATTAADTAATAANAATMAVGTAAAAVDAATTAAKTAIQAADTAAIAATTATQAVDNAAVAAKAAATAADTAAAAANTAAANTAAAAAATEAASSGGAIISDTTGSDTAATPPAPPPKVISIGGLTEALASLEPNGINVETFRELLRQEVAKRFQEDPQDLDVDGDGTDTRPGWKVELDRAGQWPPISPDEDGEGYVILIVNVKPRHCRSMEKLVETLAQNATRKDHTP